MVTGLADAEAIESANEKDCYTEESMFLEGSPVPMRALETLASPGANPLSLPAVAS